MKTICSDCKNEMPQYAFCCMVCGSKERDKEFTKWETFLAPFQMVYLFLYIFVVGVIFRRPIK